MTRCGQKKPSFNVSSSVPPTALRGFSKHPCRIQAATPMHNLKRPQLMRQTFKPLFADFDPTRLGSGYYASRNAWDCLPIGDLPVQRAGHCYGENLGRIGRAATEGVLACGLNCGAVCRPHGPTIGRSTLHKPQFFGIWISVQTVITYSTHQNPGVIFWIALGSYQLRKSRSETDGSSVRLSAWARCYFIKTFSRLPRTPLSVDRSRACASCLGWPDPWLWFARIGQFDGMVSLFFHTGLARCPPDARRFGVG